MRRILPLSPMLLTTRLPGTHSLTDLKFSAAAVRAPAMKAAVRTRVVSRECLFNLVTFRRMSNPELSNYTQLPIGRTTGVAAEELLRRRRAGRGGRVSGGMRFGFAWRGGGWRHRRGCRCRGGRAT